MSLFGSLMGDFDDDPLFGNPFGMVRQMNSMMNSFFSAHDHFNPMLGHSDMGLHGSVGLGSLLQFPGVGAVQSYPNRLLQSPMGGHSFSSSTVVSMTSGPDGRPQVYKATSSTRTGPGGITETQKSVEDSRSGTKKLAIGHHIGERAHIIEKEQNLHTGDREERQDFINLEEDEADDFNKEWMQKSRSAHRGAEMPRLTSSSSARQHRQAHIPMLALGAGPSRRRQREHSRNSPSALGGVSRSYRSVAGNGLQGTRSPYLMSPNPMNAGGRKNRNMKNMSATNAEQPMNLKSTTVNPNNP